MGDPAQALLGMQPLPVMHPMPSAYPPPGLYQTPGEEDRTGLLTSSVPADVDMVDATDVPPDATGVPPNWPAPPDSAGSSYPVVSTANEAVIRAPTDFHAFMDESDGYCGVLNALMCVAQESETQRAEHGNDGQYCRHHPKNGQVAPRSELR